MGIAIEQAVAADIPELIELRLAYLADDFGVLAEEERAALPLEIGPYLEWHMGRDLRIFVARSTPDPNEAHEADEGTQSAIACCAWLLLVDKPPSPRFPRGKTGVLFNVYTRDDYRRQGLARRVMQALLDEARAMRLDVVELHATDDGYPLYQGLGFADDSNTHKAMRMML